MLLQLAACVSTDAMFAFLIDLHQDGPQPPWLLVNSKAGISDEGIRLVSSWVSHHWLGAKVGLELFKGHQASRVALVMAFNLSIPGVTPSSVNQKPS